MQDKPLTISDINILQIEPTTYCNAKCPHCPRFDSQGNLQPDLNLSHLDVNAIRNNLELEKMTNLQVVILEGDKGDPIMHPKILEIIDIFANALSQPEVHLVTNGSIRSPAWWRQLAEKKYSKLQVVFSIDGLKDLNHLYRIGLNYGHIMNNVRSFISAGGSAIWKFIMFRHNEHQLDEVCELSKQLGFVQFEYVPCRLSDFNGQAQWPVMQNGVVTHYLQPPQHPRSGIIKHIEQNLSFFNVKSIPERICPNLSKGQLYITHQNHVIPCCMMHFDTELKYFGTKHLRTMTGGFDQQDLVKYSISEILNHEFFNSILTDTLKHKKWHFNCARNCKSQILENLQLVQSQSN